MIITKEILDQKVPKDMIPTRLDSALNLYTNVHYQGENGIIVYNINPSTCNCLYPFYEINHKFTIDNYQVSKEDLTYKELIEEYKSVYQEIYEKEKGFTKQIRKDILREEFKKTFNLHNVRISEELEPIYELKYSKSKNVWTIYYFENYVANDIDNINNLLNQELYEQKILLLDSTIKEIDGVDIVSNIPYLLHNNRNVEKLNKNIMEWEER